MRFRSVGKTVALALALACFTVLAGCSPAGARVDGAAAAEPDSSDALSASVVADAVIDAVTGAGADSSAAPVDALREAASAASADQARERLALTEDYRAGFGHGPKPAEFQRYIVLHDTEGAGDAASVASWWDSSGAGVAAHFVVNKDGSIVQCVSLDEIAHHAGFGDAGHNERYGVADESRDDKVGTTPVGAWAPDYGMNSYSVGIEMVHMGGEGDYPEPQLRALDDLVAYIDAYYGFESEIIDHKAWRTGNSDTSIEFAGYLANYRDHRSHASV